MTALEKTPEGIDHKRPNNWLRLSLAAKLALVMTCLTVIILLSFWLSVRQQLGPTLQRQADDLGGILVTQTAESITELVLANDLLSLNVVLNQLTANGSIANVAVFNVDNELIASAGDLPRNAIAYNASIALQDSIAGNVRLTLNPDLVSSGLQRYRIYFWIILTLGVGLSITGALALSSHITSPLLQVSAWLSNPLEAEPAYDENRHDEIGQLLAESTRLIRELQSENPGLLLGTAEGTGELDGEDGRYHQASVITIQVRNIETALELLHPHTLARLLEEFRQLADQAAKLYGGRVSQNNGATLTLLIDADDQIEHALNAVCCAQLFRLLMQKINVLHNDKGSPTLDFSVGVHSGDLFQCGSGDESVYIGHPLSLSNTLSNYCQPDQLLISEACFSQAMSNEQFSPSGKQELSLEADNESYIAYILGDDMGSYTELLRRQVERILPDTGRSSFTE